MLDLRDALKSAGIVEGFQWLNGSFAEDVERLRQHSPADIDVVTFAVLGDAAAQNQRASTSSQLFDQRRVKATYLVDHYVMQIDHIDHDERFARRIAYWYSMWAHQRDTERWKGFVSVPLQSSDLEARDWLDQRTTREGGAP